MWKHRSEISLATPIAEARFACVRKCYAKQAWKNDYTGMITGKFLTRVNFHPQSEPNLLWDVLSKNLTRQAEDRKSQVEVQIF